jgi:YjbR
MNIHDFRRLALSLPGAEESSHMGSPDFRVGGRIFATLAAAKLGYGNIMITPEQQASFVEELPEIFIPVAGGWGRGGATHVNLASANEDVVLGALQTAHKLRVEKNAKTDSKPPAARPKGRAKPARTSKRGKGKGARSKSRSKK